MNSWIAIAAVLFAITVSDIRARLGAPRRRDAASKRDLELFQGLDIDLVDGFWPWCKCRAATLYVQCSECKVQIFQASESFKQVNAGPSTETVTFPFSADTKVYISGSSSGISSRNGIIARIDVCGVALVTNEFIVPKSTPSLFGAFYYDDQVASLPVVETSPSYTKDRIFTFMGSTGTELLTVPAKSIWDTSSSFKVEFPFSFCIPATESPTGSPSFSPTESPTRSPSDSPTAGLSVSPTASPTMSPTQSPSSSPSNVPTGYPTESPSLSPTSGPTRNPTESPAPTTESPTTAAPSSSPSYVPTGFPTESPSRSPTSSPTRNPTESPAPTTEAPTTEAPTTEAPTTEAPAAAPTSSPARNPTESPALTTEAPTTEAPSSSPSNEPTGSPTEIPSRSPTSSPTRNPTESPAITTEAPTTATPTAAFDQADVHRILIVIDRGTMDSAVSYATKFLDRLDWNGEKYEIVLSYTESDDLSLERSSSDVGQLLQGLEEKAESARTNKATRRKSPAGASAAGASRAGESTLPKMWRVRPKWDSTASNQAPTTIVVFSDGSGLSKQACADRPDDRPDVMCLQVRGLYIPDVLKRCVCDAVWQVSDQLYGRWDPFDLMFKEMAAYISPPQVKKPDPCLLANKIRPRARMEQACKNVLRDARGNEVPDELVNGVRKANRHCILEMGSCVVMRRHKPLYE